MNSDLTNWGIAAQFLIRRDIDLNQVGRIQSVEGGLEHADRTASGRAFHRARRLLRRSANDLAKPDHSFLANRLAARLDPCCEEKRERSSRGEGVGWLGGCHRPDSKKRWGDIRNRFHVRSNSEEDAAVNGLAVVEGLVELTAVPGSRRTTLRRIPVTIPSTMKAVVLYEYAAAAGLRIEEVPTPTPGPGQVLIEVAASPINPSDLAFIDGNYVPRPEPPTRPGLEGSGTVVAGGRGPMGRYLNRRRVAFVASTKSGAWADYVVVPQRLALPLGGQVSLQAGAMSVVNPMTALAFLELARSADSRAVVNTAAAGALGRMIDRVLSSEGIEVINVVRRPEHVEALAAGGADIVLDVSSTDFDTEYKEACHEHGADLALDAIGGTLTRRLLAGLPRGSTVVVYGGLSEQAAQVEIGDLVFAGKTVTGFWLTRWLPERNPLQILRMWRKVQRLIGDSLGSEVQATYPLEQVVDAIRAYQSEMSAGKVLLTPAGQS